MIVVGNGVTQETFLKAQFVIFRCQKYVKKGYIEMTKKIYLETFEKCPGSLHFTLLNFDIREHHNGLLKLCITFFT